MHHTHPSSSHTRHARRVHQLWLLRFHPDPPGDTNLWLLD
jgi:hypothetical protein